ncbi:helix-turn-helix domain-containing protein [Actinomadura rubrisoli]|uniref:XRE family transcriptional regulator n=1 Tax=Actinomadura rubrisoli TaxID=2530368 RepID=A0A4R5ABR7_9ACTN|nr:helix-turn-helix domain-containing protein [Actinomadura rubrisoli]TDD68284.1 XRE family transcriptional regulator [Actinomadura rubrisoli]
MATFGETMRAAMTHRRMSLRAVARAVPCDPGHLSHIWRDHYLPGRSTAEAIEHVLGIPGQLTPILEEEAAARRATLEAKNSREMDEDVRRRQAIQMFTTLGISALGPTGEAARQLMAVNFESEFRDLDHWHITISDHMHALNTRPARAACEGLVIDLFAIERQLGTASASEAIELQRINAALATIHANGLTRLGDHSAAIHWSRTARTAADTSGDLELRLLVRGAEANRGLYGQRTPATILRLTGEARRIGGDSSSIGLAKVKVGQAKALSMVGRHEEAKRCLRPLLTSLPTNVDAGGIPGMWKNDVRFAQSWVHAYAGEEGPADQARDQVLTSAPAYQHAANVRLHEALCATVNGGAERGFVQAAEIYDGLPVYQKRSQMIVETCRAILRAAPPEQQDRPAARDLRAITEGVPR